MIEDGGLRIAVLYLDRQSSNIKPYHGGAQTRTEGVIHDKPCGYTNQID